MKNILIFSILMLACSAFGAPGTPIKNGYLQNDLNGNGQSETNLIGVKSRTVTVNDSTLPIGHPLNTSWVIISNGAVIIVANTTSSTNNPHLYFVNTNGAELAEIMIAADHAGGGEFEINVQGAMGLNIGKHAFGYGTLQIGQSLYGGEEAHFQYDDGDVQGGDHLGGYPDGLGYNSARLGHSKRLNFIAHAVAPDGTKLWSQSGIVGGAGGTNNFPSGDGFNALGELWFYTRAPYPGVADFTAFPGTWVFKMMTNGMDFRGKLFHEQQLVTSSTVNNVIDFSQPYCMDLTAGTTTLSFTTANETGYSTNIETKVVIVRSGAQTVSSITWPSGWIVTGPSIGTTLPTSLTSGQLVQLTVQSVGLGETNKIVFGGIATDNSFTWDSDFIAYSNAVSVGAGANMTDITLRSALNAFVVDLKNAGCWVSDILLPFPYQSGWTSTQIKNAAVYNLRFPTNCVTWTSVGGFTFNGNGVTGDGTGYGVINYIPSRDGGGYQQNSAHIFFYGGSTSGSGFSVDPGALLYAYGNGTIRAGTERSGAFVVVYGLNCSSGGTATTIMGGSSDYRGPFMATRTASGAQESWWGASGHATDTTTSSGVPNTGFGILGRWDGGSGDHQANANIRGVSIGPKIDSSHKAAFFAAWDKYENTLSRKVP